MRRPPEYVETPDGLVVICDATDPSPTISTLRTPPPEGYVDPHNTPPPPEEKADVHITTSAVDMVVIMGVTIGVIIVKFHHEIHLWISGLR